MPLRSTAAIVAAVAALDPLLADEVNARIAYHTQRAEQAYADALAAIAASAKDKADKLKATTDAQATFAGPMKDLQDMLNKAQADLAKALADLAKVKP